MFTLVPAPPAGTGTGSGSPAFGSPLEPSVTPSDPAALAPVSPRPVLPPSLSALRALGTLGQHPARDLARAVQAHDPAGGLGRPVARGDGGPPERDGEGDQAEREAGGAAESGQAVFHG